MLQARCEVRCMFRVSKILLETAMPNQSMFISPVRVRVHHPERLANAVPRRGVRQVALSSIQYPLLACNTVASIPSQQLSVA